MRRLAMLGAMVAAMLPVVAVAAPPTEAQKTQFMQECMHNSGGNSSLCSCKTEQAMKLIDADFMAIVIKAMVGTLPVQYSRDYAVYVSRSNAVCAPGM